MRIHTIRGEEGNTVKRAVVAGLVAGLVVSLLPVSIIAPTHSTGGTVGACTLSPRSGRTIINFDERLRANQGEGEATAGPVSTFLSAGIYRVTLVSFDDHSSKPDQNQNQERWFAVLRDSGGSEVVRTPSIDDLPESVDTLTQVVSSRLTVSRDVTSVSARHTAFPGSVNSITAVCAAFDVVEDIVSGARPDVRTESPRNVDENSATLHGNADPNGDDTDAWFEWGTNPSSLTNTTFVQGVGDGTGGVDYSVTISGLDENTTYHYRAVARNANGTDFGSVVSFTTDDDIGNTPVGDEPEVTTLPASDIDDRDARLRGEVRPNGLDTEVWFEWGTSRFRLNRDTPRQQIDESVSVASFDARIDGLDEDTTYFFRAVAENDEGIDRGSIRSFRTDENGRNGDDEDEPDIRDIDVDNIEDDRARLICEVDANGSDTDVWFEWDRNEDDVEDGRGEETRTVRVDEDETRQVVRITIDDLDRDTRYFFRCVAENREGKAESRVEDFRTDDRGDRDGEDDEPEVTTRSATDIDENSTVLRGEVDPNGEDTDAWFEWGTSRSDLSEDTRVQDVGRGTRESDFDQRITGLRANTTYFFRAVAENREGIDRGSILSFRTESGPTVVTSPPTVITRFVEVFRDREEPREDGLIITLDADTSNIGRDEIAYTISYDNRTDDTFTDAVLIVDVPDELEFVDADPREDSERRGEVTFEIGTIRPGDDDSFVVETGVARGVEENDDIVFTASVEYIDDDDQKIVTVVEVTRIADGGRGAGFLAFFAGNLGELLTNPFLWLIILLVVIFFVYRYFATLAKPQEDTIILQPPAQQRLPQQNGA